MDNSPIHPFPKFCFTKMLIDCECAFSTKKNIINSLKLIIYSVLQFGLFRKSLVIVNIFEAQNDCCITRVLPISDCRSTQDLKEILDLLPQKQKKKKNKQIKYLHSHRIFINNHRTTRPSNYEKFPPPQNNS